MANLYSGVRRKVVAAGGLSADPINNPTPEQQRDSQFFNPYHLEDVFGKWGNGRNGLTDLFRPDEQITGALRGRAISDAGARSRSAQLALEAGGGAALPGGYGVASLQSELGGQHDLSQQLNEANLSELQRAQKARQDYYTGLVSDYYLPTMRGQQQDIYNRQADQRLSDRQKRQKGLGVGISGPGGLGISFAQGGFTPDHATPATVGEHGSELVIPHEIVQMGTAGILAYLHGLRSGQGGSGGMDSAGQGTDAAFPGRNTDLPEPPVPYQHPEAYQPHGFGEHVAEFLRNFKIQAGQNSPGWAQALAGGAAAAGALTEPGLKRSEQTRTNSASYVDELNKRQMTRYDKQLGMIAEKRPEEVYLPGVGVVRTDSDVYKRFQSHLGEISGTVPKESKGEIGDITSMSPKDFSTYRDRYLQLHPKEGAGGGSNEDDVYNSLIGQTSSGASVMDASNFSPKDMKGAITWAAHQRRIGNPVLVANKGLKDKLDKLDSARGNIEDMRAAIQKVAPANAGSRLVKGPLNTLAGFFQTDPEINSFKTFRVAAIGQLQALAGGQGSGLRINQAEIKAATENDIPQITDTYDVAVAKLDRVSRLLDRVEGPITGRYRRIGQAPAKPGARPPLSSFGH